MRSKLLEDYQLAKNLSKAAFSNKTKEVGTNAKELTSVRKGGNLEVGKVVSNNAISIYAISFNSSSLINIR